jgi:hypothetical protein
LQGGVYRKLVVLRDVNYIMATTKTIVCLVFFYGVWQWLYLAWEVVGGIYEQEHEITYLTSYIS